MLFMNIILRYSRATTSRGRLSRSTELLPLTGVVAALVAPIAVIVLPAALVIGEHVQRVNMWNRWTCARSQHEQQENMRHESTLETHARSHKEGYQLMQENVQQTKRTQEWDAAFVQPTESRSTKQLISTNHWVQKSCNQ